MTPIYVIEPYLESGAGDIFSLVWSPSLQTIYIGCQNTSLQWLEFHASVPRLRSAISVTDLSPSSSGTLTPIGSHSPRRAHKFFDSYPQYERKAADIYANNSATRLDRCTSDSEREFLTPAPQAVVSIPGSNVIDSAHYGYIYCMAILEIPDAQLATGSGDETVKVRRIPSGSDYAFKCLFQIWACSAEGTTLLTTFEFTHGAVLALTAKGDTLYAGCQDGYVKVLDLETQTLIRTIIVHEVILAFPEVRSALSQILVR
jgi:di- and tripeptidase